MMADLRWYLALTDHLLMGVSDRRADLQANRAATLSRLRTTAQARP
ncbi:MAG: hypothetical protein ACRDWT_17495 [Jatrophihabitantaceae bacterium]